MSTLVFVNPKISTLADRAQSPRVPIPFPKDVYEAIRQAYLVETETPESPHTVASPTQLPDSTPPTLVTILCRTACIAVRISPAMSPGLSASIAEVAAMSDSAFHKRFRSSYESSPSSSPPDLSSQKHYWGTFELVEDDKRKEEDKEEEDEEIEEISDSDSESEDAEDEGPTAEDKNPAAGDRSLRDQRVIDPEDGIAYIDIPAYLPPAPHVQTPPSFEWSSASPTTVETEGFLTELGAQVKMQGGLIRDHMVRLGELSPALFERNNRGVGELFNSDTQRENRELRLQIAEERRGRLDLAKIVDSMRRGQEPRGDV
ncbi:hypothetical protein Tco_1071874 [Tanacetum coccineum]